MWDNILLRNILPLIQSYLNRRSSLNMLRVCKYWNKVLKEIVSSKYPIVVRYEKDFPLSWSTVFCTIYPFPKNICAEKLIIRPDESIYFLDCNELPKNLKMLGLKVSDTFNLKGNISDKITNLNIYMNEKFPYNLLTANIQKIEIIPTRNTTLNFKLINKCQLEYIHIRRIKEIFGDISQLSNSYNSLKKLTINLNENTNSLENFNNLEVLDLKSDNIIISRLPRKLKVLKIESKNIDFSGIETFTNIIDFSVSHIGKIYFPPNIKKVSIIKESEIEKLPDSITECRCLYSQIYHFEKNKIVKMRIATEKNKNKNIIFNNLPNTLRDLYISGFVNYNHDTFSNCNITNLRIFGNEIDCLYLPQSLKTLHLSSVTNIKNRRNDVKIFQNGIVV